MSDLLTFLFCQGKSPGAVLTTKGSGVNAARFYRSVGKRISEERDRLGWNQQKLADAVGIGRTSLTNIEGGRQRLLLHVFVAIAQAVGTDPKSLLPTAQDPLTSLDQVPEQARDWVEQVRSEGNRKDQ